MNQRILKIKKPARMLIKQYLFLGGVGDGQRRQVDGEPEFLTIGRSEYRKIEFSNDVNNRAVFYVDSLVDDIGMIKKLISNYKRG